MAAIDLFPGSFAHNVGVDSPAIHGQSTTGDDATDLTYVSRALVIGTAGNVKVTFRGDTQKGVAASTVTIALPAGWNPMRVSRVWSAGLTAVGVVAVT
jgi:hypothetical protein